LAIFAAIRRASALVSSLAADHGCARPGSRSPPKHSGGGKIGTVLLGTQPPVSSPDLTGVQHMMFYTFVVEHGWLEYAAWIAQIVVTLVALGAAFVAWWQLGEMRDYRNQRLKIANAALLMELDHRFDSREMTEARELFVHLGEEISSAISANHPMLNEGERLEKAAEEWTARLADLRKNKDDKYQSLLRIGGFFETVGLMVKKEYISKQDAVGLFSGPIILFGRNFSRHIELRQNEVGVPKGLFEHALYLYEIATSR
jgi:hypothetical protein